MLLLYTLDCKTEIILVVTHEVKSTQDYSLLFYFSSRLRVSEIMFKAYSACGNFLSNYYNIAQIGVS